MALTPYDRDWPPAGDGVVCRTSNNSRSYFNKELGTCALLTDQELDQWILSGPKIPGQNNSIVIFLAAAAMFLVLGK